MNETTISPLIAPSASAAGFLTVASGSLAGQRFVLPPAPGALLLGRERMCNVRFDPERDRVVGRTHARIEVRPDGVFLIDLNSANGTFRADGTAIRGEVRLSYGERFQLGGEGGPWMSLELPAAPGPVAVHLAPPPDTPTVVTRPSAPAPPPPAAWPAQPSAFPSLRDAAPVPPAPSPAVPVAPQPVPHLRPSAPEAVPEKPTARPRPAAADPVALQHQRQYHRQIGVIALLLVLACSLGLALGLRDAPSNSGDEAAQPN